MLLGKTAIDTKVLHLVGPWLVVSDGDMKFLCYGLRYVDDAM